MRTNKGFSLVELMIVVAIIGILAAIAIPNFITMQLKAKRGELPGNVDGIKTAELAYDASFDGYVSATEMPRQGTGGLDKNAVDWTTDNDWTTLNWKPDGQIRGSYQVSTNSAATDFTITGSSDVDNDDTLVNYTATTTINATIFQNEVNYF